MKHLLAYCVYVCACCVLQSCDHVYGGGVYYDVLMSFPQVCLQETSRVTRFSRRRRVCEHEYDLITRGAGGADSQAAFMSI